MKPEFTAGKNLAIKVPVHEFEVTVVFYRDVLGLEMIEPLTAQQTDSVVFRFGENSLWIDRVASISQAEIWLEIVADDILAASDYLASRGCTRRDEIERLPESFRGFWISGPSNIIHLIN